MMTKPDMPEPDQIVIPRSWVEFRERFTTWYQTRSGNEIGCSLMFMLVPAAIIFFVCMSFLESRIAIIILVMDGAFISVIILLSGLVYLNKRIRIGRGINNLIIGVIGILFSLGLLIKVMIEWMR